MEGISKAEVIEFLKSLNLPESKFLSSGEIIDIYSILGIEPQFHRDGTRVLTPYELIGVPPQFYDDGTERPIVFVLKNRCKKIGKYEGRTTEFVCKNNKVKDTKNTLEELKARYKRAVLNGDDEASSELFAMIDSLSGGNARELLSSFFNYAKFYKKMKKQLLIDMFAHFFMMYIYARVKAARGGLIRKNRIYKPFKTVEMQTTQTVQQNPNTISQNQTVSTVPSATMQKVEIPKVEVVDVSDFEDGINPESFGIKNLKSITIDKISIAEEPISEVEQPQATQPPIPPIEAAFPITQNVQVEEKPKEEVVLPQAETKQSAKFTKKESKGLIERIADFFDRDGEEHYETADENSNELEELETFIGDNSYETDIGLENDVGSLGFEQNIEEYSDELLSGEQNEMTEVPEFADTENNDNGDAEEIFEENRESELKSTKRVTAKKYGAEFDTSTKETKVQDQPEEDLGMEYDFEG